MINYDNYIIYIDYYDNRKHDRQSHLYIFVKPIRFALRCSKKDKSQIRETVKHENIQTLITIAQICSQIDDTLDINITVTMSYSWREQLDYLKKYVMKSVLLGYNINMSENKGIEIRSTKRLEEYLNYMISNL